MAADGIVVVGSRYALDGVLCRNCSFTGTTFEYGGGQFALIDAKVVPPISIDLTGAAKNTAGFLNMFGLIGCPNQQAPKPKAIPPIFKAAYTPSGTLKIQDAN